MGEGKAKIPCWYYHGRGRTQQCWQAPVPPADALRLSNIFPHTFEKVLLKLLSLYWSPQWMSLFEGPLRKVSRFPTGLCFSWTWIPLIFKARHFRTHFSLQPPRVGAQAVEHRLLAPQGGVVRSLLIVRCHARSGLCVVTASLPVLPFQSGPFTVCFEGGV